ncbi:MAG: lysozyme inhibitor LprI family protein [Halomonas sp.]|uniref:lysozyme inhibitor LprI family protein n=1 Tax=Halomonas sp. TaxID=1486246 RepID=UPI003F91F621
MKTCLTPLLAGLWLAGCAGGPREALPESSRQTMPVNPEQAVVDCTTATAIDAMVCEVGELAALDQKLSEVIEHAEAKTHSDEHERLYATHHSWFRQRDDDCAGRADQQRCLSEAYQQRIATLQARYGLVEQRGPLGFVCKGRSVSEVTVTWFDTTPETLIAQRGDSESLMVRKAGESVYCGRNESLSEQGSAIMLEWGHDAPQISCQAAR